MILFQYPSVQKVTRVSIFTLFTVRLSSIFSVSKLSVYCRTLSYLNHIIFQIWNHTWLVPAEDSKELSFIINNFIFLVHIQISSIRRIECTLYRV